MIGKLRTDSYLIVTFLNHKLPGQQPAAGCVNPAHRWLKIEQLRPKPNYILDESTNKLLQQVQISRGVNIAPCDMIVKEDVSKMKAAVPKRQESQPMEQKNVTRENTLEHQVLELAGYGDSGMCLCTEL